MSNGVVVEVTPANVVEVIAPGGPPGPPGPAGATTLAALTDVTGTPGPSKAPVYDANTGLAPLTAVPTQDDLDAILAQVVWHKVDALVDPWQPSNPTAVQTPDGVLFGPYADASAAGGSLRYLGLNGQPLSVVQNLAYDIRYREEDSVDLSLDPGAAPYLRIFTMDAGGVDHDYAFTPGSQPYTGLGPGPFQEFVPTAADDWRRDDDAGTGGVKLAELQAQYGDEVITKLTVTVGFTAGTMLTGLLRWWQINGDRHAF
jgi:hypothetical protein